MANVFYVSEMNATAGAGAAATFGVAADAQPTVSYATVTTIAKDTLIALTAVVGGSTVTGVSTYFSFYLDVTSEPASFVGVTNDVPAAFPTLPAASSANSTSAIDKKNITDDFIELTAQQIFGYSGSGPLINNTATLEAGYDTALDSVGGSVNTTLGNNSANKTAASNKLVGQIAVNYIERFALMYRAASVAVDSAFNGLTAAALYPSGTSIVGGAISGTAIVVRRAGSSSDASWASNTTPTIGVKMSDASGNIESIYITSNSDQWTSNTGSGFLVGDTIAFKFTNSDSTPKICVVKIDGINAVQAAILNGTLDNSILYAMTKDAVLFNTNLNIGIGLFTHTATSGTPTATTYTTTVSGTTSSGAGAVFTVVVDGSNVPTSITLTTNPTTPYVVGDVLILTNGANTITLTALTALTLSYVNSEAALVTGTTFSSANDIAETNTGSGAGATFDVIMNTDNTVSSIRINSVAAANTDDYASGNAVTLTQGASTIVMTLTAAMANVLNGAADAGYATFPVPLIGGNYPFTHTATTNTPTSTTYTTTIASGGDNQSGAGAVFTVVVNGSSVPTSITLSTKATADYIVGNILTLTNGSNTITLGALTAKDVSIINNGADGTTYGISVLGGAASTTPVATVDVTMADKYTVETIALNTATTGGFVSGDTVSISTGSPQQKMTVVLNATTAAILNGTADALSTNGLTPAGLIVATNLPLEAGDKIRMQQGVSQASGQKNTKGELVTYAQTAFVDYLLG